MQRGTAHRGGGGGGVVCSKEGSLAQVLPQGMEWWRGGGHCKGRLQG